MAESKLGKTDWINLGRGFVRAVMADFSYLCQARSLSTKRLFLTPERRGVSSWSSHGKSLEQYSTLLVPSLGSWHPCGLLLAFGC